MPLALHHPTQITPQLLKKSVPTRLWREIYNEYKVQNRWQNRTTIRCELSTIAVMNGVSAISENATYTALQSDYKQSCTI